ncbi:hypothetical protein ACJX0J_033155 [Zea mays]
MAVWYERQLVCPQNLLAHLFSFDSATTSKRYNEAIHLKVEMRFKEKVGQGGFGTTSSMNFNPKISDFGLAKLHNGFRHAGVRDGEWKEEFRPRYREPKWGEKETWLTC